MSTESIKREAKERAERARAYAAMFPNLCSPNDPYTNVEWQEQMLTKLNRKIQEKKP
jgi:hypothetical protein